MFAEILNVLNVYFGQIQKKVLRFYLIRTESANNVKEEIKEDTSYSTKRKNGVGRRNDKIHMLLVVNMQKKEWNLLNSDFR